MRESKVIPLYFCHWLTIVAVLLTPTALFASSQKLNPTPTVPPCESCSQLYEQSHVLLETCQPMTGNEQIECLDRYNEAATRYESCMLRELASEGGAPLCQSVEPPAPPISDGKGRGNGKGSGKTGGSSGRSGKGGDTPSHPPAPDPERLPNGDVGPVQLPPQPSGQADGTGGGTQMPAPTPATGEQGADTGRPIVEGGAGTVIDMGGDEKPCPEALAPIATTATIPSAAYLTRVGMPLYMPRAYDQVGNVTPALPAGKLAWIIAQALEETSQSKHNNIVNIQPNASEIFELKELGFVVSTKATHPPEYLAESDEGIRVKGMDPQNAKTGKWIRYVTVTRPVFRDYVAAVSAYLWFMDRRFPAVSKVLTNPSSTIEDFAASLAHYGTSDRYANTPKLTSHLKAHLRAQSAYLAQRISIMQNAPCGTTMGDQVEILKAIQLGAEQDGKK